MRERLMTSRSMFITFVSGALSLQRGAFEQEV